MSPDLLVALLQEALLLSVIVALPPLGAALLAGVVGGFLQAATGVQDPSVGLVPRILAALVALVIAGPWMMQHVAAFASRLMATIGAVQL